MNKNATIPIDARVVALDETYAYYIKEKDKQFIKTIRGVYLYNKNEITHLCEITPSYYLIHLYDQVILTNAAEQLGDFGKDDLYQTYEYRGGENIYVHCHQIDKMEGDRSKYHLYGETGVSYDDSDYDDQMEGLREHFCGNHAL